MKTELSRRKAREQAFILAFERNFIDDTIENICQAADECREFERDKFTMKLIYTLEENKDAVNKAIEHNSKGWKIQRLSKVTLSVLQLAVCELLFIKEDIHAENPESVIINEAIVLAKKYSTADDASFVNGVLGAVVRAPGE